MNGAIFVLLKNSRYPMLDALKGIACILIILIHAPIPGIIGSLIITLARTAVAFFFFLPGFFSYNIEKEKICTHTLKKIKSTGSLIGVSFFLYLIWDIFIRIVGTGTQSVSVFLKDLFSINTLYKVLLFHESPWAGHLWFINALFVAYVVFFILVKYNLRGLIFPASITLLCINFVLMNILPFYNIQLDMHICRNAWFYGIPVFFLGFSLREAIEKRLSILLSFEKLSVKPTKILLGFISILLIMERWVVGYSQLYIFNIVLLIILFWAIQKGKISFRCNKLEAFGKYSSMYVYISHWAIIACVTKFLEILDIKAVFLKEYLIAILSVFISVGVGALIPKIKHLLSKRGDF